MCSYRDIQFVPLNDTGYQAFRAWKIERKNLMKAVDMSAAKRYHDPVKQVPRVLETLVRARLGGSEPQRIIRFKIQYGPDDDWIQLYQECDYVRHENDRIVIAEIKGSESYSCLNKGFEQLHRIAEILTSGGYGLDVIPELHFVDFSGKRPDHWLHVYRGLEILCVAHPFQEVLDGADNNHFSYDDEAMALFEYQVQKVLCKQRTNAVQRQNEIYVKYNADPAIAYNLS